jgi:3-dehydroquinate dehydratase-1
MTKPLPPQIVAVIFSRADLRRAIRMRNPPDLFELRLDGLVHTIEIVRAALDRLGAPLIITARHPREGGANRLSSPSRRSLLIEFLPRAAYVDVELRSARHFGEVLRSAQANKIRAIVSFHDFRGTPSASRLDEILRRAESLGADLVKIATRTDTPAELARLLDFFERRRSAANIVAMGIGKLGRKSRLELARRGCALNYARLGEPRVTGQLSIGELRRALP